VDPDSQQNAPDLEHFKPMFRKFLSLPDPDASVRCAERDSIIRKNCKKILDFYSFVTSYDILSLKNDDNFTFKK
jgi:hypothetical protein